MPWSSCRCCFGCGSNSGSGSGSAKDNANVSASASSGNGSGSGSCAADGSATSYNVSDATAVSDQTPRLPITRLLVSLKLLLSICCCNNCRF